LTTFNDDFEFGEPGFTRPSSKEDKEQGIDAWIGNIPVAWRKRRISIMKYKQISIRYERASRRKTEKDKILDGTFIPKVYFFQFTDALVICYTSEIKKCLQNRNLYKIMDNCDGTWGCYIRSADVANRIVILAND